MSGVDIPLIHLERSHTAPVGSRSARRFYFPIKAMIALVVSGLRGLWVWVLYRPKTPLRVLCIMAFDTLSVARHGHRLPLKKLGTISTLINLGACSNAVLDHKKYSSKDYRKYRRYLVATGNHLLVKDYLCRLKALESCRPPANGDSSQFYCITSYRESVVRLSLGTVALVADCNQTIDGAIQATYEDASLNLLFRIVMLCQIMDDVLDHNADRSAGLPSFMTATGPFPRALSLTRQAAHCYAHPSVELRRNALFPLPCIMSAVTLCTKIVLGLYSVIYSKRK